MISLNNHYTWLNCSPLSIIKKVNQIQLKLRISSKTHLNDRYWYNYLEPFCLCINQFNNSCITTHLYQIPNKNFAIFWATQNLSILMIQTAVNFVAHIFVTLISTNKTFSINHESLGHSHLLLWQWFFSNCTKIKHKLINHASLWQSFVNLTMIFFFKLHN